MTPSLIPIPAAAAILGMDVKILRGLVWRGTTPGCRLSAPIGSVETDEIYAFELPQLPHALPAQAGYPRVDRM